MQITKIESSFSLFIAKVKDIIWSYKAYWRFLCHRESQFRKIFSSFVIVYFGNSSNQLLVDMFPKSFKALVLMIFVTSFLMIHMFQQEYHWY